ncbi:hypothetical protein C0J27_01830 [Candidatus Chromulinivorax destructor]|uniref:Uncharacterized protein n=2 Tax=Candidatus Chromulinivorax destructor TaxID=2066483 RepID=A0A345ZB17_9BACT|nr:hypothetical protein C0J27_01830 [Candidatus Chromulinivorax destructor]
MGLATGALLGTTVALAATSGGSNNNSAPQTNPVDQATAEQIRYETKRKQAEDEANEHASDAEHEARIKQLEQEIAQLQAEQYGV